MDNFKKLTDYFQAIDAADVSHTGKTYLAHAIGVANDLKAWGCDDDLQRAGLFHSVYGTEKFQRFALPVEKRSEIREMIGERAERLAYWNCAMDRATFDETVLHGDDSFTFMDRLTGEHIEANKDDFYDLMTLHLCDWLEQVPRSQTWDYRRAAYRRMAERLGGTALASYEQVFALEPAREETSGEPSRGSVQ